MFISTSTLVIFLCCILLFCLSAVNKIAGFLYFNKWKINKSVHIFSKKTPVTSRIKYIPEIDNILYEIDKLFYEIDKYSVIVTKNRKHYATV